MLALKTQARTPGTKSASLREKGLIPAVCYGPKFAATSVAVSLAEFSKIWKQAGESTVVVLETDKGKVNTLIHDVQVHSVKGMPLHADFYVVEAGKEVEVHVPIEFEGVAPAVKELGGILVKVLHELEIKAVPDKLPHAIVVDIGSLADFESQILVRDIKLPAGVSAVTHDTEVVASIAHAVEEKEEPVAVDLSTIEVEKKGKKDEEEGEAQP